LADLSDRYNDVKSKFDLAREIAAGDESTRTRYLSETFTRGNVEQSTDILTKVATTISKLQATYSGFGANPVGRLNEQLVRMNYDLNRVSSAVNQYNANRRLSASQPEPQATALCPYGITTAMCDVRKATPAPRTTITQ